MYIHRNSLINKIYGIFSIDLDINQTRYSNKEDGVIHLMLMRNLAQIPGRYILRTFDLKGSEYAREALKKVLLIFVMKRESPNKIYPR